jgi:hypothetical protein
VGDGELGAGILDITPSGFVGLHDEEVDNERQDLEQERRRQERADGHPATVLPLIEDARGLHIRRRSASRPPGGGRGGRAGKTLVTFASPIATDAVGGSTLAVCTPPSGSLFKPGETVVTCTATDA